MSCFHPITGYQTGGSGKLSSNWSSGATRLVIACGQCRGCRLERSRQWAVRIMHEAQMHEENCWITLTYNNEHLPQDRGLHKPDFVNFMKRFRHELKKDVPPAQLEADPARYKVRYYQCGEYGEPSPENNYIARPHHHACIFGQNFHWDRKYWRTTDQGHQIWRSATLDNLWKCTKCEGPLGYAEIGDLTQQSAGYTARYIMKKQTGQLGDLIYRDYITGKRLESPYTTMSTNKGIGRTWIDKYHPEVYPNDQVVTSGAKARPPKYYDTQYEKLDPQGFEALKKKRQDEGGKYKHDNTPRRRADKEIYLKATLSQLKRTL